MANISSLFVFLATLLYCQVVSATSPNYYNRLKAGAATRLRKGECKDDPSAHKRCQKIVEELGQQICFVDIPQIKTKLKRSCAETCKLCPVYNKLRAGERRKAHCKTSPYGCCWDNHTSKLDDAAKGCPVCKDHFPLCRRFKAMCTNKENQHNRALIELHCPLTCGKCSADHRRGPRGRKIKMSDWNLLWLKQRDSLGQLKWTEKADQATRLQN